MKRLLDPLFITYGLLAEVAFIFADICINRFRYWNDHLTDCIIGSRLWRISTLDFHAQLYCTDDEYSYPLGYLCLLHI